MDIHPSAGRILLSALAIVVLWYVAVFVTDRLREGRVDTWTGPDATVQSGLRLDGCQDIAFNEDVYFPSWVRFEGGIFRWSDSLSPIGPNSVGRSFIATGYRSGDLELFRVANNPEGLAGRQIMLRQGTASAGAIYVLSDCG
ncbi:MAG: hypothetical protein ABIQ58_09115 [Candidatus Limnocylindrales bacterium]